MRLLLVQKCAVWSMTTGGPCLLPNLRCRSKSVFYYLWGETTSLNCRHWRKYCSSPRWYEFGERWWNDIDRGNRRTRRKTFPSATLSTTNPTWIDPGANTGLRGERRATNDLNHGTALGIGVTVTPYSLVKLSPLKKYSVFLWKVRYFVHKTPSPALILDQRNPVHILQPIFQLSY
jgi:hypothetical protein